jgi:hypothetical protein
MPDGKSGELVMILIVLIIGSSPECNPTIPIFVGRKFASYTYKYCVKEHFFITLKKSF